MGPRTQLSRALVLMVVVLGCGVNGEYEEAAIKLANSVFNHEGVLILTRFMTHDT